MCCLVCPSFLQDPGTWKFTSISVARSVDPDSGEPQISLKTGSCILSQVVYMSHNELIFNCSSDYLI